MTRNWVEHRTSLRKVPVIVWLGLATLVLFGGGGIAPDKCIRRDAPGYSQIDGSRRGAVAQVLGHRCGQGQDCGPMEFIGSDIRGC